MKIRIKGAREHNLKGIDVDIGEGLTVVTGVSGSGKTSLVFDTVYHESRRRFLEAFSVIEGSVRLSPSKVELVSGLGPAVAVGQNLLNRNPLSTLATASGLHPFLRLLYARFGTKHCPRCGASQSILTEDEIADKILSMSQQGLTRIRAVLVRGAKGSHRTLLRMLAKEFGSASIFIDGGQCKDSGLRVDMPHDIDLTLAAFDKNVSMRQVRGVTRAASALGARAIKASRGEDVVTLSRASVCAECGTWFGDTDAVYFHRVCPYCKGKGCGECWGTGLHPRAASVRWEGLRLPELLALPVEEVQSLVSNAQLPSTAARLKSEIQRRLDSLVAVGLGYVQLSRPSPSLSRGESQRVRLAVCLGSQLEDILHILDEPTIGQHPADISRLLPTFGRLKGPVVYVEHDRTAASIADTAIDVGPGAGTQGGQIVFRGTPTELWKAETASGRYFSFRERVSIPEARPAPESFLTIRGAYRNNLKNIDICIPLSRLTVITGVSGSGKSTLVEEVLVPSLNRKKPVCCRTIEGSNVRALLVDQSPIGKNPRSNPATYTKLSEVIRDIFALATGLRSSYFSFNRREGACPRCKGIGAVEVKMRYLPSTWLPCTDCGGKRYSDKVLSARIPFGDKELNISDFYELPISEVISLLRTDKRISPGGKKAANTLLDALETVGLGYLPLGQPSPTLSGGEAQRVKLAKFLGRRSLTRSLLVLDEPSTGLHPKDLAGLLRVLDRLVRAGATIVVVEHNPDIIRAADWVVDLGPGAGPRGGQIVYAGPLAGLEKTEASLTCKALKEELSVHPGGSERNKEKIRSEFISITNARANNLRSVSARIRKSAITVVTGVSGSGKSSLLRDVLESEAKRRYLEVLTMYERQGTHEGPEAPVDSVVGLGVTTSITPGRRLYSRRSTVGTATEIWHHLAVLLASVGARSCLECGAKMKRSDKWVCPNCGATAPLAEPRHFSSSTYSAACDKCHGIGSLQAPMPEKLIVNPDRPICAGAMHSPGFFPKGYLCRPFNGGYYIIQALAARYGFDPATTPWNKMTREAQKAFLFGDSERLKVTFESRSKSPTSRQIVFRGFYGWVRDWDVGGTYTRTERCDKCRGTGFKPDYLAVTLDGYNIHNLSEMTLSSLNEVLSSLPDSHLEESMAKGSLRTALKRLHFLQQVGLGYLHLNQVAATLSAGEAQRVRLASLLGSNLTSLTVLLDEPTRGMHASEVDALLNALVELRNEGNTVIIVEHDPALIRAADEIIDMGPGAGTEGGRIVAQGTPDEVAKAATPTGIWLRGEQKVIQVRNRREPKGWLVVNGARANNLKNETVRIPLGLLVGLCGVSGSGKSTLLIDTLGRVLAPQKTTTSVAREPLEPGEYDSIEGAPKRAVILDQSQRDISSPMDFLDLFSYFLHIYSESEDAKALGLDEKALSESCSACHGRGIISIDMGFLPKSHTLCETCGGTGRKPEAREVRVEGVSLAELGNLTIDEASHIFGNEETLLGKKLKALRDVGLGYLVLRQPGHTLSGGEAQRLRIARDLTAGGPSGTLYILDEPTVGQHMEDVNRLIEILRRLVDEGHSVIVIEHHPILLASCDWLIELGPGGGPDGGRIIASGPPEIVASKKTPTSPYIEKALEGRL